MKRGEEGKKIFFDKHKYVYITHKYNLRDYAKRIREEQGPPQKK